MDNSRDLGLTDYLELDATAAAEAVRAGEVGPVELVQAALERIESTEPSVNACTVVFAEDALAEARRAEGHADKGRSGPLFGVPVVVKDVIWVKGAPATMGSRVLEDFVPGEDATSVRRLREAGAIVIAKVTNPPFCEAGYTASELYGVTRNPWDLSRTPGGSSGGSGAAVAAGMTPLALGTDAGGSIRVPASFSGLVGMKPSHGLVARGPCFEELRTLNSIGPMARTVRDIALCLNVIAGPDAADDISLPALPVDYVDALTTAAPHGLRVAWSADLAGAVEVDDQVRNAFVRAIETLESSGWKLEEACPRLPVSGTTIHLTVAAGERGTFADGREDRVEATMRAAVADGARLTAKEYWSAQVARASYVRSWEQFFQQYDAILMPSVTLPPFAADGKGDAVINGRAIDVDQDVWWELSLPGNLTGSPALSVPMGLTRDGLPLGLQVMAPRFEDARCVAMAARIEELMPWQRLAPLTA